MDKDTDRVRLDDELLENIAGGFTGHDDTTKKQCQYCSGWFYTWELSSHELTCPDNPERFDLSVPVF